MLKDKTAFCCEIPELVLMKQYVSIDGSCSTLKPITIGVPQGSVLGPLFYIIYVDNFCNAVTSIPRLYANDTCMVLQDTTVQNLQDAFNLEMANISQWMKNNKLTINPTKSSILPIQTKVNQKHPFQLHLAISQNTVTSCESVKYHGVI